MPTTFTRSSGLLAILAPLLLIGGEVLVLNAEWTTWSSGLHVLGSAALMAGMASAAIFVRGLQQRYAGIGVSGIVAMSLFCFLAVFVIVLSWAIAVVAALLAVAAIAGAVAMLRHTDIPRTACVSFSLGPVLFATVSVPYAFERDPADVLWGPAGVAIAVAMLVGFWATGRQLAWEQLGPSLRPSATAS